MAPSALVFALVLLNPADPGVLPYAPTHECPPPQVCEAEDDACIPLPGCAAA